MNSANPSNYNWLSDDEYNRLKFRVRANINKILSGLRRQYGQAVEVDGAVEVLMYVIEESWKVVRGKDKPIKTPSWFTRYDENVYRADD